MIKPSGFQISKSFWRDKTVLVTGHQGFLGGWLFATLAGRCRRVIGIDKRCRHPHPIIGSLKQGVASCQMDLTDFEKIRKFLRARRPDFIFHLAAEAVVGQAHRSPREGFCDNIEATWNILEACRDVPSVQGIIVASSDKAYGSQKKLPYTEDMPLQGINPYDVSKSCADLIAHSYWHTYQVPVCVTRCGNVYGPGDLHYSRLVPDAIRCLLDGKRFVIRSNGKYTRDFIFVEDVIAGYLRLAERMRPQRLWGEAFNFSYERPMSVFEVFACVARACAGACQPPKILNRAEYEIRHQYLDASKARKVLRWRPLFGIDEGMKITVDWYRRNASRYKAYD